MTLAHFVEIDTNGKKVRIYLTDAGNAQAFADEHGDDLCWVPKWRAWAKYDGKRWEKTSSEELTPLAVATARALYLIAARKDLGAAVHDVGEWSRQSETASRIEGMVKLARGLLVKQPDVFDRDKWSFNVANGTIDLRTGTLRDHRREDMITLLSPVEYDPDAKCPTWNAFLERILPDPKERSWLQRFVGYCLTGTVQEQIATFFYGKGANGKSTLVLTLKKVFGDYAGMGPKGMLDAKTDHAASRRLVMKLQGLRLVFWSETEAGQQLSETTVKDLTGSEQLTGAELYQKDIDFDATHKPIVSGNHKPRIIGQDLGIWRRIVLVPFNVTIPEAEKDLKLPTKLEDELSGILAWAVRGCLDWQRNGLQTPSSILDASLAYRTAEDRLADFFADHTEPEPESLTPVGVLYARYRTWFALSGVGGRAWSERAFGDALEERGYKRTGLEYLAELKKQARCVVGVKLRPLAAPQIGSLDLNNFDD